MVNKDHQYDLHEEDLGEPMVQQYNQQHNMRTFATGATRDTDTNKLAYSGFISPLAMLRFAEYMHKHRKQADGQMRDPDNWKKGIPVKAYKESLIRHVFDFWLAMEQDRCEDAEDYAAAILFNAQGFLHERMKMHPKFATHRRPT